MTVQEFLDKFYRGDYPGQRLGQVFINQFGFKQMPDLFYEENEIIALEAIFKLQEEYQLP